MQELEPKSNLQNPRVLAKILPGIFVFNREAYTPMYLNNN